MEDLLLSIVKEATKSKQQNLKQSAQIAYDKLSRQHGIHIRDPSHELRSVCFTTFHLAFDSKRQKFISLALNGMQRIIRDDRFYAGLEPEDDSLWLPSQLLRATSGITTGNEENIINILRLFLAMACSPTCTLNGRLLIELLSRCGEYWESGSRAVKASSLAASSQTLSTFCNFLKEENDEIIKTAPNTSVLNKGLAAAVFNEVIPVMQWLCSKLIEQSNGSPKKGEKNNNSLFLTECILTLTSTLPPGVRANPHFTLFLWQKFCPTLAEILGSPRRLNLEKKFNYKDAIHLIENENRGFFTRPGVDGQEAKCIYLTAVQLLRIAGAQGSLRPMLEALFHRMLLVPTPQNRIEPLKCVREIFKSPGRLIDLSVILFPDKNQVTSGCDDMALFRLLIDAMEECATSSHSGIELSLHASVECIVALLTSLQNLSTGEIDENTVSEQVAHVINTRYKNLKEADYTGPLTYQLMARLPASYRDAVAELRQNGFESASDTDSDGERADAEVQSTGSGDTEGPEDDANSSCDDFSARADENWPWNHMNEAVQIDHDYDRQHARDFAKILTQELVPNLLKFRTSIEVDECMQEFASKTCQRNSMNYSDFEYNLTPINADGIYLATYSALLLGLQLMNAGHYDNLTEPFLIPLSEQQFVTSVQNAGILVFLSSAWLRELYQCILATNPLASLSNLNLEDSHCALIDMICDAGGIRASQMLSEWQRLHSVSSIQAEANEKQIAAKKIARRLLTCCWDSMVTVLTAGLGEMEDDRTTKLIKLSKKTLRVQKKPKQTGEALYALSLEGLHAAATLSNTLQLQHLAGKILKLIATNVCQISSTKISATQALSIDVVLSGGLELGSHSSDCWLPVFSVCRHVTQLEHDLFSSQNPSVLNSNTASNVSRDRDSPTANSTLNGKLNLSNITIDDDETCIDVYSFLQVPLQGSNTNIPTILKTYSPDNNELITLSQADTVKVLCALAQKTENLFSEAAERLALPAICQFLKCLCRASREQLYANTSSKKSKKSWWLGRPWKVKNDSLPFSLLLHRVGDVTLKIFRSPRPLLHILKIWAITGPHLMDAAAAKDRTISKRAIEYIHDIITALLAEQTELPHFHFNEALLKPFENLLSMELSDEVQDQIVGCLYEIVEAGWCVGSGWLPLFATLRKARNRAIHLSNIVDIFRVFLETDNMQIFSNAGLDCILCLLSYLEISGSTVNSNGGINDEILANGKMNLIRPTDFLYEVLKFLERCSSILAFMYKMPYCNNLNSTYKIKGINYTHIIDANISNSIENFQYFGNEYMQNNMEKYSISYRSLHIDKESIVKIDELDKPSGVLKVWFLLLDGLTNSLIVCPIPHQAPILQTIFKLFKSLLATPGYEFGFYCINHLLIGCLQDWLRYINKTQKNWSLIEKNFKHCCGMTTDLFVEYFIKSQTNGIDPQDKKKNLKSSLKPDLDEDICDTERKESSEQFLPNSATLALKQLLLVLIECSAQSQESVARVGVSCLKHIIFSIGYTFTEDQWMIICSAIHRASTVTIAPLRQLSLAFNEKSESFYGDCANVKVAARRESTIEELMRIHSLAQQVFLLDNQRHDSNPNAKLVPSTPIDDRSYSFLLYPLNVEQSNLENYTIRIPYRSLIVGMLASQMLLQLIANVLLHGGLQNVPSELNTCIYDQHYMGREKMKFTLGPRSKEILLRCLKQYLICATEFDSRPGLKFLIQKVSNIEYSANLYKQMTSSWIIHYMTLVDIFLSDVKMYKLTLNDIQDANTTKYKSQSKKRENFQRYLLNLQETWNSIAVHYIENHKTNESILTTVATVSQNKTIEPNIIENQLDEAESVIVDSIVCGTATVENADISKPDLLINSDSIAPSLDVITPIDGKNSSSQRKNPFNISRTNNPDISVSPEIENQRTSSIQKDLRYKRSVLTQLVIASMELLRLLPIDSSESLKILLTPNIKEAFRLIQLEDNTINTIGLD